ncbi:MAG: GxxExxY protein [Planctomycetota bacterium]|nr:MAG: GxxExxY protein [Planctomycetota bacterium]
MYADKDPRTHAIIGAAMAVHSTLGTGFLEAVYQESLAIECNAKEIPFRREVELPITYKNLTLQTHYRADFICYDSIVIEIKALSGLTNAHQAQVINYLKASGLELGLLINFGTSRLEYKRLINSHLRTSASSADQKSKSPQIAQMDTDEETPHHNHLRKSASSADQKNTGVGSNSPQMSQMNADGENPYHNHLRTSASSADQESNGSLSND